MAFLPKKEIKNIPVMKKIKEEIPKMSSEEKLKILEDELAEAKADVEKKKEEIVEKEQKRKTQVVMQLPTQPVRQIVDEDGTIIDLITIEEALTEIMNQ